MMNLTQRLSLEQKLTPQQVILSTLLQLPLLSLEQKLKTEIELNPLLEEDVDLSQEEDNENADDEMEEQADAEEDVLDEEKVEEDIDWDELLNDESQLDSHSLRNEEDDFEKPEVYQPTMAEHLLEQLKLQNLSDLEYNIAEYLVYNIKDDGYLDSKLDLRVVGAIFDVTEEKVESVLKIIQKLDPVGIGSRDLRECLLAQLEEDSEIWIDSLAYEILDKHWDDFINKRYQKLMQNLQIDDEILKEIEELIKKLNPKPGKGFWDSRLNYIIPDFIVEKMDGKFVVSLNEWNMPPLRISSHYLNLLAQKNKIPKDAKHYLKKKLESARWFLTAIQQRRVTMLKVMNAIVDLQFDFFDKGPDFLKPMIQKDVAEKIDMDISTVSRVVNGKYVQTEYGVFELKSFFSEGMMTEDGEEVSTRKIKNRLSELIENETETNKKPYSDQQLADILQKEGYPVARRTVAKYREQLGIPVARLRKKL